MPKERATHCFSVLGRKSITDLDSLQPASQPAEDFIGNRAGLFGQVAGGNLLDAGASDQDGFIPRRHIWNAGDVDEKLIHTDAPNNGDLLPMEKRISGLGAIAWNPIRVTDGNNGDGPLGSGRKCPPVSGGFTGRQCFDAFYPSF